MLTVTLPLGRAVSTLDQVGLADLAARPLDDVHDIRVARVHGLFVRALASHDFLDRDTDVVTDGDEHQHLAEDRVVLLRREGLALVHQCADAPRST